MVSGLFMPSSVFRCSYFLSFSRRTFSTQCLRGLSGGEDLLKSAGALS